MNNHQIDISSLDFTKPISHYSNLYNIPVTTLRSRLKKLGVYDKFIFTGKMNPSGTREKLARIEYEKSPTLCKSCKMPVAYENRNGKFCSSSCSAKYSNSHRTLIITDELRDRARKQMLEQQARGLCVSQKLDRIEKKCQNCNKSFSILASENGRKFCSRECASKGCDKSKMGGLRQNSGRGKSGWYKGIFCNSSWELVWVIYKLDHGEFFTRNTTGFEYMFGEKLHRYYPDFILNDTITYVEVKGYDTEQWKAKKEQFPHTLQIIGKEEIKPYIKYVMDKYGTDFIRLYEGNPHDEKKNVCLICGKPCKNKYCSRSCSGKGVLQRNSGKSNFFGKKHTPESKTRIRNCMLNRCYSGPHHLLGARWINNGIINKRTHDVDIPVGWSRGRKKKL